MFDSHCHLADQAFAADLEAVVERARQAGVTEALCILSADELDEVERASTVAGVWPDVRFATGVHPHRSGPYGGRAAEAAAVTRAAAMRVSAAAIGEIGLDYHYDLAPRNVQQDVFSAQLALAVELDRPVIIHTREATADTEAIISTVGRGRVRGVMHCFTGSKDEARSALDLGFFISLAGILTFPKADALREAAAFVPPDRLLVETDAPFLAPVPHRGKRNEPAWVMETMARLAIVRGESAEAMAATLERNYQSFLGDRIV